MDQAPAIDSARVIADLRALDELTGGAGGARRVCWGEEWRRARAWLGERLAEIALEPERDEAGNLWAYLPGEREPALALGSHLDSVPAGGWLDGALGVLAALGVLRAWAEADRRPPRTLALVDFADEEGSRFGRSLFGSSAVAGTLAPEELEDLVDADGAAIGGVLVANGIELAAAPLAAQRLERVGSYLELHIEQGPALDSERCPCAAVSGCAGVERVRFSFSGQASHAGTTPMDARSDAGLAAAELALAVERAASEHGGVGTAGALRLTPGIVTAVAGEAELGVDLRHPDPAALAAMLERVREAARRIAAARGCRIAESPIWRIDPIPFDPDLVVAATQACAAAGGRDRPLPSGALHDAAEIARVRPAGMVFAASRGGISHAKEEDSDEAALLAAIEAFGALAARAAAA
jgi:hydantoinase/carbamoylase family amidase